MTEKKLKEILEKHRSWLGAQGGERAYLWGADLSKADLSKAYLSKADLWGADLSKADLSEADLRGARLSEANLRGANLSKADLSKANLSEASLRGANLSEARLSEANLSKADLSKADLCKADLENLKINWETIGIHPAPEGEIIGWKSFKGGAIGKLRIPSESPRSCATTRKHRCKYADVLKIWDRNGNPIKEAETTHYPTVYKVGERIEADTWDEDRWNECSHGIHFFLSREEAESWA